MWGPEARLRTGGLKNVGHFVLESQDPHPSPPTAGRASETAGEDPFHCVPAKVHPPDSRTPSLVPTGGEIQRSKFFGVLQSLSTRGC